LISQYGFGWHPCHLCILQRYPYAAVLAISVGVFFLVRAVKIQRVAVLACALLFIADAGIAFYHSGVERGLIKGPSGCSGGSEAGKTLEEMTRAIMEAPLVSCEQPMGYILGLSMAEWNALAASAFAFITLWMWRKTAYASITQ
jgi:disulfide bond formation protein DsbB